MDEKKLEEAMAENVEKSFNDAELQDIMDEIETLEKEFVEEPVDEKAHTDKDLALSESKENDLQNAIDAEVATIGNDIVSESTAEASEELVKAESEEPLGDFEGEDLAQEVEAELAEVETVAEVMEDTIAEVEAEVAAEIAAEVEQEAVSEPIAEATEEVMAEATDEVVAEAVEEVVAETVEEPVAETVEEVEEVVAETIEEPVAAVEEVPDNVVAFKPTESMTSEKGSAMNFSAQGNMNLNLNFSIGEETGNLIVNEDQGLKVSVSGVEFHISEEAGCVVKMPGGIKFEIPLTATETSSKKKAA